jgi:hypothetical protein
MKRFLSTTALALAALGAAGGCMSANNCGCPPECPSWGFGHGEIMSRLGFGRRGGECCECVETGRIQDCPTCPNGPVIEDPTGAHPGGFPGGAFPPGAFPPGAFPPGAFPPGASPPGAIPMPRLEPTPGPAPGTAPPSPAGPSSLTKDKDGAK